MKNLQFLTLLFLLPLFMAANTHTIGDAGLAFVPDELTIQVGDTVNFDLTSTHNAVEVSMATWMMDGTSPLSGGFNIPFGGGTYVFTEPGTYYYVCQPHVTAGMKGTITVLADSSDPAFARAQIIHNSPSPTVDIWVNGEAFLTDFEFRTATPFVDVPADVELTLVIAPSPSTSVNDGVATFTVTFEEDETYVIIANGIVGDTMFPFNLEIFPFGKEEATLPVSIDILGFHGSPGAPAVDLYVRDQGPFVTDISYAEFDGYQPALPGMYILDVNIAGDSANIVASFDADLSTLAGEAVVVMASGFVSPGPGEPAFGLIAILPNGTVIELPFYEEDPVFARAQIIHNSPSPMVDIWVNGQPFLTNFEFRTATPFVDVPAEVELTIVVAPSPSTSPNDGVATFTVTFEEDETYVIIANGIVGSTGTPFTLDIKTMAIEESTSANFEFFAVHGSPDAPAVDVAVQGVGVIVPNAAYGDITGYIPVAPGSYLLDVLPAGTSNVLATYEANLTTLGGASGVVFASGLLAGNPDFGLFLALADGTVAELPLFDPTTPATARAQIIHNSPSPTVDIWVNGQPFLTNFEFRTATPFVDVPAEVELTIVVAPSPSTSPNDGVATFTVTLEEDETYVIIANGIVGSTGTPFTLDIKTMAIEESTSANFEFFAVHGSPDAPAVDVAVQGVGVIIPNAAYGDITGYIPVAPGSYLLDVLPAGTSNVLATYEANLTTLGGASGVVFASGLLAGNPDFGLFLALADGTVAELPLFDPTTPATARAQIIHNSPSPTVDIWVNGEPFLTNFEFRTATPFVDVPAGVELTIVVAPSPSTSPDDGVATFTVTFEEDETYVIIANGIVGDMDAPFTLDIKTMAIEESTTSNFEFFAVHGSPDAPAVDVAAQGVGILVPNAAYGDITDYISVAPAAYLLDVLPAGTSNVLVTYEANLTTLGGASGVVFASGLLAGNPGFGLFLALADGTVFELPLFDPTEDPLARLQIIHNSPSPTVDIWVNGQPFLTDFEFRTATSFVDVPAEVELTIVVAPSPSTSPNDGVATFNVTLEEGETYIAIAQGLVGNGDTPFTLLINNEARESSTGENFEFFVVHGSPDAPDVAVIARDVATLVPVLSYGDITDYIGVPAGEYIIDLTPAGQEDQILLSYNANLLGLGGESAVVFASGYLSPEGDEPLFALYVTLADGTTLPLPIILSTRTPDFTGTVNLFPNPVTDIIQINMEAAASGTTTIRAINTLGQTVRVIEVSHSGIADLQMDAKNWPSGMYYIELIHNGERMTIPVSKN
jgi:plastocyanin